MAASTGSGEPSPSKSAEVTPPPARSAPPLDVILWGCIAMFAIRNQSINGAVTAVLAAALSSFGIIHSATVAFGAGNSLTIALSYLMVAAVFAIKYVTDGSNRGA